MQTVYSGQANTLAMAVVAKASGNPIEAGTVNFYLKALTGTNAGNWYRGSDQTWQAAVSIAGESAHRTALRRAASCLRGRWGPNRQRGCPSAGTYPRASRLRDS